MNSRVKGWMQTLVVHVRDPKRLWRELGPLPTLSVLAMFAGGVLGPLLWPLFSAILLWHAWSGTLLHPVGTLAIARSTLICLLVYCGLISMVAPLVAGAIRQGMKRYLFLLPLLPLWQIALCVSAWMAFTELFANPYRWAKTEHGLAKTAWTCHQGRAARVVSVRRYAPSVRRQPELLCR